MTSIFLGYLTGKDLTIWWIVLTSGGSAGNTHLIFVKKITASDFQAKFFSPYMCVVSDIVHSQSIVYIYKSSVNKAFFSTRSDDNYHLWGDTAKNLGGEPSEPGVSGWQQK